MIAAMPPPAPAPKVFGIGLSRTGTTSLTAALRMLGFRAVHYPLFIVRRMPDGSLALDAGKAAAVDALTDIPAARFYKELDVAFPGAKFVLTVRDTVAWRASMRRLARPYAFLRWFPKVDRLFYETYGVHSFARMDLLTARYESFNREVREYFAARPHDLLVLDVQSGHAWRDLCGFLGRAVPDVPFPWHNRRYDTTLNNILDFFGL